jgi:hypothetical protein
MERYRSANRLRTARPLDIHSTDNDSEYDSESEYESEDEPVPQKQYQGRMAAGKPKNNQIQRSASNF